MKFLWYYSESPLQKILPMQGCNQGVFFTEALAEFSACQLHDSTDLGCQESCMLCYRAETFTEAVASTVAMPLPDGKSR